MWAGQVLILVLHTPGGPTIYLYLIARSGYASRLLILLSAEAVGFEPLCGEEGKDSG
jgi:hypothetical protein